MREGGKGGVCDFFYKNKSHSYFLIDCICELEYCRALDAAKTVVTRNENSW